jgi:hypothetical protein
MGRTQHQRSNGQRGQALLIVLVFLAAFMILVWAGLTLASGSFLAQNSVQSDTRTTYALDAGVAYGMEMVDLRHGNGCSAPKNPPALVLNYPTGNVTVNATVTKGTPCSGNGASFTIVVTASGTSRKLTALETEVNNNQGAISWEQFQ